MKKVKDKKICFFNDKPSFFLEQAKSLELLTPVVEILLKIWEDYHDGLTQHDSINVTEGSDFINNFFSSIKILPVFPTD